MTFAHMGLAIAGLAAVSIPIIIHLLFRRRRRPVQWAAMRFIMEALRRQRRRLRLEQLLLLLARCLLIALVGLAIGRPLLEKAGVLGAGGRDVYLLIDNSIAANIRADDGTTTLDRLKSAAARILESLGPGDRAGLVTLASPAEVPVVPASANIPEIARMVRDLEPTAARADLAGALERLGARLGAADTASRAERDTVATILSDFRLGSADTTRALPDNIRALSTVRFLAAEPAPDPVSNIQVLGVEPVRGIVVTGEGEGSQRVDVRVRLRRTGPAVAQTGVTTVRVREQGAAPADAAPIASLTGETVVKWEAGQADATAVVSIEVVRAPGTTGDFSDEIVLRAEIDRDPLDTDNAASRIVGLRERLRVGIISADIGASRSGALTPADWVRLALAPLDDSTVAVEPIEPLRIDLPIVARLDAVFILAPDLIPDAGWSTLATFADRGGLILIAPPEAASTHTWPDTMSARLGLDLRMARDTTEHPGDGAALDPRTSSMLGVVGGANGGAGGGSGGGEFERLAQPVRIARSLPFEPLPEHARAVLALADGAPWIVAVERAAVKPDTESPGQEHSASRGAVLVFGSAISIEWSDLPARPLMVPLMQELLREGVGRASTSSTIVAGAPLPLARDVDTAELTTGASILVGASPAGPVALSRASGIARLRDEASRPLGLVAINPDTDGARTDTLDPSVLRQWLAPIAAPREGAAADAARAPLQWMTLDDPAAPLARADRGAPISLPLLIAALAVALAELAMARWFSHAFADRRPSALAPEGAAA